LITVQFFLVYNFKFVWGWFTTYLHWQSLQNRHRETVSDSNSGCTCLGSWGITTIHRNDPICCHITQGVKVSAVTVLFGGLFGYDNAVYDANVNTPSRHSHGKTRRCSLGATTQSIMTPRIMTLGTGSTKANGREPKSCFGWVFNFKLGRFVMYATARHIQKYALT
jgi:hypothetical protein